MNKSYQAHRPSANRIAAGRSIGNTESKEKRKGQAIKKERDRQKKERDRQKKERAIAIAAGATGFSHVNDSGFWMISRYMRMSEAQTLKTWSVVSTAISIVGFAITMILWQFVA